MSSDNVTLTTISLEVEWNSSKAKPTGGYVFFQLLPLQVATADLFCLFDLA